MQQNHAIPRIELALLCNTEGAAATLAVARPSGRERGLGHPTWCRGSGLLHPQQYRVPLHHIPQYQVHVLVKRHKHACDMQGW